MFSRLEDDFAEADGEVRVRSKRCSLLVIVLGAALAVAVIGVIGLAAGLGVNLSAKNKGNSDCTSELCIHLSDQIFSSLDQSIDPCDDFYAFACNGFIEEAIIPFGAGSASAIGSPRRVNVERIRVLMESGQSTDAELVDIHLQDTIRKAITYYESCLQGDSLEVAVQTFQQLLRNLGGWPLLGINPGTPWSLNNREGFLTEQFYGSQAFFSFSPFPSPRNSSKNIWTIIQSGLTFPASVAYDIESIRDLIKQVMMSAFTLINPSISTTTYSAAIDDIINFETELASFYDFDGLLDTILEKTNYMTYGELSSIFPRFNWRENFLYYGSLANVNIDLSAPINVLARDYLISLDSLLGRTNPVVLENYAKWQLLLSLMPYMSEEFAELVFQFQTLFLPDIRMPQRYVTCVNYVEQQVPLLIARAFTEVYLPPDSRDSLSEILAELETALRERINSREWLDGPTRERALSKLNSIQELVAYPDRILNNAFLNDYYSTLDLSADESYLWNHVSSILFNSLRSVSEVDRSASNNRSLWYLPISPPTITNAAYLPFINQIYIFEGILDTPVFENDWPDYFKYGTIGYVVGHEYTHGFDNHGRRFNEVGNVENWWSSSSEAQFKSRAQCFIDQYDNYYVPVGPAKTMQVNGTLTLGENIADNGGLKAAYQAYKNRLKKTAGAGELTLPGLPYSPDQLFYIGSAQLWCQVATDQIRTFLLYDEHSPSSIRPLGALSNNREFADAFNCPGGSRMNPARKCELW